MADLRTKLTLDGSDFTRGMNDAAKSVEDFTDASQMSASELLNQMKSMDKLGRSTGNYRSQLAQMTRQIQDLTMNYRAMSDEMKNSDFGQAVASKIEELTARAAEMKDTLQDAQASVKLLSSDTANLDALKMGMEGVSSAISLVASAGIFGADTTEKLVKVIARLKAIEAATNAVIKIANILNKDSILMLKLKALWTQTHTTALNKNTAAQVANNAATKAGTTATAASTVATKGATTAAAGMTAKVGGLTTAVKGLSVGIKGGLAGAILALIVIYGVWAEKQHLQHEMQKRGVEKTKEEEEAIKNYGNTVGSSIGKALYTFDSLKKKYEELDSVTERTKFLNEYKDKLKEVGIYVNNINDLEEVFTNNTDAYRKAVIARAQARALESLIEKQYQEAFEKAATTQEERKYETGFNFNGQYKGQEFFDLQGLVEGVDYTVIDRDFYGNILAELTGAGALKLNKAMTDRFTNAASIAADKATKYYRDLLEDLNDNLELKLLKPKPTGNDNGSTSTDDVTYMANSLAEAQAEAQRLQTILNNLSIDDTSFGLYVAALDAANAKVEEIKEAMKLVNNQTNYAAGSYAEAAAMVSRFSTELQNAAPNTQAFEDAYNNLQHWTEELERIKSLMEATKEEAQEIAKADPFAQWKDGLSTVGKFESSFSNMYSSIKNLGDAFKDCEDPLQAIFTTIDSVLSILNNITTVLELINTLEQISVATALAKEMADKGDTQEKIKQTIINSTNLSTEQAEAVAASVKAAADAGSSASKIPVVGWVLAIGAIAAIIAAIASAKSSVNFAGGGIVPGSSFAGDHIQANLNSGEMVLNKTQQQRLFNMLDNGTTGNGGKVEFVIKGQDLKGVLSNYDKKMSRV